MALRQFPLQRGAQVLHLLVIDEQVRVPGDAELVAAQHVHAGEQFADMLVQDGGEKDVAVIDPGQFLGQMDHPRQGARRLDDGGAGTAAEGVRAFQFDGEVQALVEDARKWVGRIESDWREQGHHFAKEVLAYPGALWLVPEAAADEDDALGGQGGQDDVVLQRVLLGDQGVRLVFDAAEQFLRRQSVVVGDAAAELDLFLQAGDADLEEFVEIRGDDAEEA